MQPIEAADFDLVEIKTTNECPATPHCKKHGAMNKITADGIWRCMTVNGYRTEVRGNVVSKIHLETVCRAGCFVVKE